jgi:hypothetical protein
MPIEYILFFSNLLISVYDFSVIFNIESAFSPILIRFIYKSYFFIYDSRFNIHAILDPDTKSFS